MLTGLLQELRILVDRLDRGCLGSIPHFGSGGGGAGYGTSFRSGGNGGSGIIYVRFKV